MDHPDEGTIHAWLDGALSRADSVELEQHVAGCTDCASAVAEARGLVAASSRIVSELDEVPAGVLPVDSRAPSARVTGATAAADAKRVRRPEPKAARKRAWYQATGYAAAAALLLVAGNRFPHQQLGATGQRAFSELAGRFVIQFGAGSGAGAGARAERYCGHQSVRHQTARSAPCVTRLGRCGGRRSRIRSALRRPYRDAHRGD